jgi:ATP/maltotriose-dependent transcriptional regulator MalT
VKQKFPKYNLEVSVTLLNELKKGSIKARDQLAEGNARLVLKIAHKFIRHYKELSDEIEDVAMRNLFERLESIRIGKTVLVDSNLGAYLNKTTVFRIQDFINKEQKVLKKKVLIIDHLRETAPLVAFNPAVYNIMLDEILHSDVFSERELLYIRMKLDGRSDSDIAEELSLSKSSITWLKKKLEPKLKDFI